MSERSDQQTDVHVIPHFANEREHAASVACWCEPRIDRYPAPKSGGRVWVHNRREVA